MGSIARRAGPGHPGKLHGMNNFHQRAAPHRGPHAYMPMPDIGQIVYSVSDLSAGFDQEKVA